jgi:branched-chain amino acid transport system ATP-binding protein
VLHHGAKLSEGAPAQVMRDPAVIKAYIGNKFAQRFAQQSGNVPL